MEWYWVIILCFIASGTGLFIGCMCRVAGKADNRAGLKKKEQKNGGVVKPEMFIDFYYMNHIDFIPLCIPRKKTSLNFFLQKIIKIKKKKFRWKNYFRAIKLCRNGKPISLGR